MYLEEHPHQGGNKKLDWNWENDVARSDIRVKNSEVMMHPTYSQGTAIIRGDTCLKNGHHHVWEIVVLNYLSGTDVMMGFGNDKTSLTTYQHRYVSALGLDENSWGYSYHGAIRHGGRRLTHGGRFNKGSRIGIHLDLRHDIAEFYVNRQLQGQVKINRAAKDSKLYPMVCATTANTRIKLILATSYQDTLVTKCLKIILAKPRLREELETIPGLRKLGAEQTFFIQP